MSTLTMTLILLFNTILLLFALFCVTPLSHISAPFLEKALPFLFHQEHGISTNISPSSIDQDFDDTTLASDPEPIFEGRPLRSVWPVVDQKDVVVLTEGNFTHFIAQNRYVMVNFYARWCSWSRKLAPEYAAAATLLKGKAVLADVDATMERKLEKEYKIRGYPTMYLVVDGVQKILYNPSDGRSRDAIVSWVMQKMDLVVQNVTTIEEAEQILSARSVIALGFFDNLEGPDTEVLAAVSKHHMDVNFYQTSAVDVAGLFQIDPLIKRPTLVMLKRGDLNCSHCNFVFDGPFTTSVIADFVSTYKLPSVTTFTEENALSIFKNPMKQLWLFAPTYLWSELPTFRRAANTFRGKLLFVHVETDSKLGGRIRYDFGITNLVPRVVAYMPDGDMKKYLYDLSFDSIESYAEDFLEDELLDLSEPISKTVLRLPFQSHTFDPSATPHVY